MNASKLELESIFAEHFPKRSPDDIIINLNDNIETRNPKKQDYDHLTIDDMVEQITEKFVSVDFMEYVERRCELENIDFDNLLRMVQKNHNAKLMIVMDKIFQEGKGTEKETEMEVDDNAEPQKLWMSLCETYETSIKNKNYHEAANTCILMMNYIDLQVDSGQLSSDAACKLKTHCLHRHCNIVDDVTEGGLNNYLEEIQSKQSAVKPQCEKWKSTLDELSEEELLLYLPSSSIETAKKESVYRPLLQLKKEDLIEDETIKNEVQELVCERINAALENCPPELLTLTFGTENTDLNFENNAKKNSTSEIVAGPALKRKAFVSPKPDNFISSKIPPNIEHRERQKKFAVKRKQEDGEEQNLDEQQRNPTLSFKTARDVLDVQKNDKTSNRKSLGSRRGLNSKFVTPIFQQDSDKSEKPQSDEKTEDIHDERLKGIDPKMVEIMMSEIMDHDSPVTWDNIAGLEFAKTTLKEIVVWPLLRPDLFTGLRAPPKGILLFGPPGTGKTLIGKCVASQSKSTFFSISASSLGSKWYGEGEKLVRALFTVARCYQPAVIFIDEIDSLLTQRSDNDHESSRRVKTEFLVQLDGVKTVGEERLLIIGATNRPQELDEAARRRLVKRLYIPLPEPCARIQIVNTLLAEHKHELSEDDLNLLKERTEGYSGADMANLCKEAALGPIRSIGLESIASASSDDVRPIQMSDFLKALNQVRASVSDADLNLYEDWNKKYGSFSET